MPCPRRSWCHRGDTVATRLQTGVTIVCVCACATLRVERVEWTDSWLSPSWSPHNSHCACCHICMALGCVSGRPHPSDSNQQPPSPTSIVACASRYALARATRRGPLLSLTPHRCPRGGGGCGRCLYAPHPQCIV